MRIAMKTMAPASLVLASSSDRRRELLRQIGVDPICVPADIDETPLAFESVEALVRRLAIGKAQAIARGGDYNIPILGADTIVNLEGEALGKPRDKGQAIEMLLRLQGKEHQVMTGVCLLTPPDMPAIGQQKSNGQQEHGSRPASAEKQVANTWQESIVLVTSTVHFSPITLDQAESYWNTGEPLGKAGAYAIQGHAARFVAHLSGSYSNVVGLPLFETARLLDCLEATSSPVTTEYPQAGNA